MKRDPYFDVLKFFAMFLVVFGHVYWALGCKTGMPYFENFRCGMNMPLFFMISGYFAARTIESRDWQKLGLHLIGYFWPLAVVSCVFAAFTVAFSIPGCDKGFIGCAGRWFLFSPWFLWCLAYCFTLTYFCFSPQNVWLRVVLVLVIFFALLFVTYIWNVGGVRAMWPHFLIGVVILNRWQIWKKLCVGSLCCIAYVVGVFVQGDILSNGLSFYKGATSWTAFVDDYRNIIFYFIRLVNGIIGSIGVMWFIQVLVSHFKWMERLSVFGTTTLGVYILHQWMLARVAWKDGADIYIVLVLSLALFFSCHYFVIWSRSINVLNVLVWGNFSVLLKRLKLK